MSKLFEQLLRVRNLDESFLAPKYTDLTDPFLLPDMRTAVERITQAIHSGERIMIYGDYDVDGVTSSTLMAEALKLAGVTPDHLTIMLPDRFIDGYGMSRRLIKHAIDVKATLVLTVDCGSRNHDIIAELSLAGVDTIVTDHHELADTLPSAVAVVNPKREDYIDTLAGLKQLAGVGVAFKLAQAMTKAGLIPDGQEKWLLDLVLLGTICDNMLLTGENRILCYYGLQVIGKTRRLGLREILTKSRIKKITSDVIGYQIGPRLNAAGRLESAELSLRLLRSTSPAEVANLVEKLEALNQQRKQEQNSAVAEIAKRGISNDPVIVEAGNWHEGILGIIAGRLVEDYHRPAFILSTVDDDTLKGSGRSFGDFNLAEALKYAKNSILHGGGHAAAAGVRLKKSDLGMFRDQLNTYYRSLHLSDQERFLSVRPDLEVTDLSSLSLDFFAELSLLEPFGAGNEEPVFRLTHVTIDSVTHLGSEQNHLRLDVKDQYGHTMKLLAFAAPEAWLMLNTNSVVDPLIKIMPNSFNGIDTIEGRILDL